ncbi:hypothetical protein RIF29_29515 [Crotalaria pallida]|uniref:Uncharacterized protein n=1 Tax=Crotalaria pallida TaxID=3830 RepID=A0AAN9EH17_CROPI
MTIQHRHSRRRRKEKKERREENGTPPPCSRSPSPRHSPPCTHLTNKCFIYKFIYSYGGTACTGISRTGGTSILPNGTLKQVKKRIQAAWSSWSLQLPWSSR